MKKYYIILMVFFLLLSTVFAGVVYETSVGPGESKLFSLSERDMLRLIIDEKEHYIKVDRVNAEENEVDLAIFIKDAETPSYATINKDKYVQLDFERDQVQDLKVGLQEVNGKNATLILVRPKQEASGYATKTIYSSVNRVGVLITIFIVILGVIIYLLLIRKRS